MALLMLVFSFFWNAVLPQFEVITLNALGSEHNKYSRVRLWGSIGFILTVVGLGWLFDLVSMRWLVPILWGLMLLVWLFTLLCPHPGAALSHSDEGPFLARVCKPEVLSFFAVYLLIQLSHGPYYTFYSLYMIDLGYTKMQIGLLWALGVVAEVVLFWMMHRLLSWTGLRCMVLFGLMVCIVRWLLIGIYPENLPLVLLAQCFHAVTFGCLHAAGIAMVQRFFGPAHQGQGQALFSSVGFGAGGALGALCSGQIWVLWGGAATFYFAAVVSLLALVIAWRGLIFEENRVIS
jgi:PPP family 3-phenylpropionic acid transporter